MSESKVELRVRKRVFMGYDDGVKRFSVWSLSEYRVVLNRNIIFDETFMVRSS